MTMKKGYFFSIDFSMILFIILAIPFSDKKESYPKNETQELEIRGGLPHFFDKAMRGDSIRVAYLGGSITAQPGWRVYSLEWFQQRFPKAIFSEINAAIGGTGSDFGVFRLKKHVLKFNPDLVFVEFAVNDSNTPSEKIIRSMEGIVRQIWQHNSKTDVCFVYTFRDDFLEKLLKGPLPNSILAMEKVADRYSIPTINFGIEVSKLVSNGQLIVKHKSEELDGVKVFSSDGVHPNLNIGHKIYLEAIKRSFDKMDEGKRAKKHKLKRPLAADYFSDTQMIDITECTLSDNWTVFPVKEDPSTKNFSRFLTHAGKSGQTGETLTVRFKGRAIGAYDIMGPDAGKVIIEIDGLVMDTISRFDKYCTYYRMGYILMDHLEDKDHVAVFKVLAEPFDKESILKQRNNTMENPDDYKGNNWYVGKILLDGVPVTSQ